MQSTRGIIVLFALSAAGVLPLACASQIVNAVDLVRRDAGSDLPDGSGGFDGSDGSDGPDGSDCPDPLQDRDGDGMPDCEDHCDEDAAKTVPGTCGCGLPDPEMLPEGADSCLVLGELLAHRYTFNGPSGSTVAVDSKAGNDGEVLGAGLSGNGTLELAGASSEQHVDLPNGLASGLRSATFEAWVRWRGGEPWQRLFDFGSNDMPEGVQGFGRSYLFLTAKTPIVAAKQQSGKLRLVYKRSAAEREAIVEAPIALPFGSDSPTHVAAVVDVVAKTMSIYVDGELQLGRAMAGALAATQSPVDVPYEILTEQGPYDWTTLLADGSLPPAVDLGAIVDTNVWLGRSQYRDEDPELAGTYYEFRIYRDALTPELIATSYRAGPDPGFLPEPQAQGK